MRKIRHPHRVFSPRTILDELQRNGVVPGTGSALASSPEGRHRATRPLRPWHTAHILLEEGIQTGLFAPGDVKLLSFLPFSAPRTGFRAGTPPRPGDFSGDRRYSFADYLIGRLRRTE